MPYRAVNRPLTVMSLYKARAITKCDVNIFGQKTVHGEIFFTSLVTLRQKQELPISFGFSLV